MKTSDAGLAFIAQQEGTVLKPYKDQAGIWTIGVGHVIRPGESFPNGITQAEAMALLASDVGSAEAAVNADVNTVISQNAYDALVDFAFNCGSGALAQSSALAKLNADDLPGAARALLLWDKCRDPHTGQLVVASNLLMRRALDAILLMTPDPV